MGTLEKPSKADLIKRFLTPKGAVDSIGQAQPAKKYPTEFTSFEQFPGYKQQKMMADAAKLLGAPNPFFCVHDGIASATTVIDGKECINFSNYDYLDLSGDARVQQAAKNAIDTYGTSVSASRVVSGERPLHHELERALADVYGVDDAIVFVSGHATNVSVIGHLFGAKDLILHDALIHNSALVGAQLSGATRRSFPHNDFAALEKLLIDMPSPFFARIGACLVERGWRVTRINLCPGDWLFWRDQRAINYRGRYADWPSYIEAFFRREAVTDLILLGENRRYHREAVDIALGLGVRVTVTDFGYLRPDWITFERNGMTGASLFPRDPAQIRALAAQATVLDWQTRFADSAGKMAVGDLAFNFANLLLGAFYPFYRRSDLRPPTLIYTLASGWRLLTNRLLRNRMQQQVAMLVTAGTPFYLFPLQLDFDYQLVAYSPFSGMSEAIDEVLDSFARHAPADALLIMKEHPWDPAIKDWQRAALRRAKEKGLAERVHYLRGGDLNTLIEYCRGVVVVNSTTGMRALQLRKPLLVLGQAVFDVPGLTHQQGIDTFWRESQTPDTELIDAFLKALAATVQLRGVFFQEPGLSEAVTEACYRLATGTVGVMVNREKDNHGATNH